ncbi:MAG TPA: molybdopterin oxidoreductase family protein [Vicinamibacteria bacterium]|nr:molybdopterin oxidoreductase family protein [Vicinamibacteria bacterium]
MSTVAQTHFRTCSLCEAMCGLAVEVQDGEVTSIRGDALDVFSRGHVCPKAVALKDVHEDPDRLRRPMRRRGTEWEAIGWEEALDLAARRLLEVQRAHGRDAVAVYQGNPVVHNYGALLFGQMFVRALQTRSRYSATSVDQLPHMLASLAMFGHQLLLPVPDLDRTSFLLVLGANPLVSNGSLMTAPGVESRLRALRSRGGRLVVVDPRRTETAAAASLHLAVRPGTDALLLLALLEEVFASGLARPGRLAPLMDGLDDVRALARPYPAESVAATTGIAAAEIRALARDFALAPAAVAYGRVGVSTQEFGGLCAWLVNVLNAVTGNLDRTGGSMFPRPAVDLTSLADRLGQRGHFAKGRSRVRGLPEFGGEWPAAVLAEEMETPGEGQVRALVTVAGNPVLSTPNGARLDRALAGLEFMVSVDSYVNETTRHAHLVLPPVSPLERDHYDLVFHALAVRNTAKYSPALFAPPPDAREDWQILHGLAERLESGRGHRSLASRLIGRAAGRLRPRGVLRLLLRVGPHGRGLRPFGGGLSLRALEEAPHGIDLGPLEPALPAALRTPSRRVVLAPPALTADLPRLRARLDRPEPAGGLSLIGRRELRSNNSWMHNSARLVKGRERCVLLMHPDDAAGRGLADGERVRVRSRTGEVEARLSLSDEMSPGVVSLPHGWGHGRPGVRLRVAAERPGVSLNDLTDERDVDVLSGTAMLSGVPVAVTRGPGAVRPG